MKYLTIILTIVILANFGCASKEVQLTPAEQKQAEAIQKGEDISKALERKSGISEEELAARDKLKGLSLAELMARSPLKDIRFEFDSYVIKTEYYSQLNEIANWLKQYRDVRITVEGHCDEKGTVEYNLALGQKRAEAVKIYLVKLGVDGSRMKTVSFGKEVPLDPGHTEEAWEKNRRAAFKIDQKG